MSRLTRAFGVTLACATLVAASPAATFAAHAGKAGTNHAVKIQSKALLKHLVFGTLKSKNDTASTLTVTTPFNGDVTVAFTANTKFTARKNSSATTIAVGDQVAVLIRGKKTAATAARVIFDTAPFVVIPRARVSGTLAPVPSGNGYLLTLKSGKTINVTLAAKVRFVVDGKVVAIAPIFGATQKVVVVGRLLTNGTLEARAIVTRTS